MRAFQPTPVCDFPVSGLLHVTKDGDDTYGKGTLRKPFLTIKHAISQATAGVRAAILVGPGLYTEDNPLVMKPLVSVISMGNQTATRVVAANPNSNLFILANFAVIEQMEIMGATGAAAFYDDAGVTVYTRVITVIDCKYGLYVDNINTQMAMVYVNGMTLTSPMESLVEVRSGEVHINVPYILGNSVVGSVLKADGPDAHIISSSLICNSSGVTDATHVAAGGHIHMGNCRIFNQKVAAHCGVGGGKIIFHAVKVSDSIDWDVKIDDADGIFRGIAAEIGRDKVNTHPDALFECQGYDPLSGKYRVHGEEGFAIGHSGFGCLSQFGEGGSYTNGVKIKSWDGSVYADIDVSGNITFPNLLAGTCLYFGDAFLNKWYALRYELSTIIVNGSIIWEYYDAGATAWVACDTLNTLSHYSNKIPVFTGAGKAYTVRFDQDIKTGVTENDAAATGHASNTVDSQLCYWVRCRIVTNLTTAPIFQAVRLKGNYTEIRDNGTMAAYGDARDGSIKELVIGNDDAGTANEPLLISPNVTSYMRENEFATVGASELIVGRWVIPDTVDLSCGVSLHYQLTNKTSPGSDQDFHFTVYAAGIKSDGKFDGANDEILIDDYLQTILSTDPAWKQFKRKSTKRFSLEGFGWGNVVYFSLKRPNDGSDTYGDSICVANIYVCFREFQSGLNLG